MEKAKSFLVLLIAIFFLSSCSKLPNEPTATNIPADVGLQRIESIDDNNRDLIGKEMSSGQVSINSEETPAPEHDVQEAGSGPTIPENKIVRSLADDSVFPGVSIQVFKVLSAGTTPELIGPNGAVGVFSKENSEGWTCKAGDSLTWSFEKYPLESRNNQALAVGYIKDGVMYKTQIFQDELVGTYQINITENGVYYIYFLCASSDPIALKEGEITEIHS